jgi:hypothetical protein
VLAFVVLVVVVRPWRLDSADVAVAVPVGAAAEA